MSSIAEDTADLLGVTMDEVAKTISLKLRGKARDHYLQWVEGRREEESDSRYRLTWTDLDEIMRARFAGASAEAANTEEFLNAHQKEKESVYEFKERSMGYLRAANLQRQMPERLGTAIMRRQLRPEIRRHIAGITGIATINELVARAAAIEAELEVSQPKRQTEKRDGKFQTAKAQKPKKTFEHIQCHECGEMGHFKNQCPNPGPDSTNDNGGTERTVARAARDHTKTEKAGSKENRLLYTTVTVNGTGDMQGFVDPGSEKSWVSRAAYERLRVKRPLKAVRWEVDGALQDHGTSTVRTAAWLRIEGQWVLAGVTHQLDNRAEDVILGADLLCLMKGGIDYSTGRPELHGDDFG